METSHMDGGILRRVIRHVITPGMKWMLLLVLVMVLFFWKILLTNQFSLLLEWKTANQAYAWYHFSSATIQRSSATLNRGGREVKKKTRIQHPSFRTASIKVGDENVARS